MTKKRYIKLLYALMQKMHLEHTETCSRSFGKEKWGRVLKSALNAKPFPNSYRIKSYQEIWEDTLADIRERYGM